MSRFKWPDVGCRHCRCVLWALCLLLLLLLSLVALTRQDGSHTWEDQWLATLDLTSIPQEAPPTSEPQQVPEFMSTAYEHLRRADSEGNELLHQLTDWTKDPQTIIGVSLASGSVMEPENREMVMTFSMTEDTRAQAFSLVELVLTRRSDTHHSMYEGLRAEASVADPVASESAGSMRRVRHRHLQGTLHSFDVFNVSVPHMAWLSTTDSCAVHLDLNQAIPLLYHIEHPTDILLVFYRNFPPHFTWPFALDQPALRHRHDAQRRARRTAGQSPPPSSSELCRLHSWYLSFVQMGWQAWVVHPDGFEASYCAGSCPEPLSGWAINYTNHALMKSFWRSHGLPGGAVAASCVPVRLSPVSMIIRVNGTTQIKHMQEMRADACGCM